MSWITGYNVYFSETLNKFLICYQLMNFVTQIGNECNRWRLAPLKCCKYVMDHKCKTNVVKLFNSTFFLYNIIWFFSFIYLNVNIESAWCQKSKVHTYQVLWEQCLHRTLKTISTQWCNIGHEFKVRYCIFLISGTKQIDDWQVISRNNISVDMGVW